MNISSRAPPRGSDFFVRLLRAYGINHVFYMEAMLHASLRKMEECGIKKILTHCEKSAVYMADGYARISGKPGVCLAQSVGAANIAAGLQDPFLACSPVIAITGKKPSPALIRNAYQEVDHAPLFQPVTKFNATVETGDQLPFLLRQSFREAVSGVPKPVHLDFLGDSGQLTESAEINAEPEAEEWFEGVPAFRPEPDGRMVERALQLLNRAERPVIVAGGGVILSGAQAQIVALAEMADIPVATSLNGKGAIPENHPCSLGVMGKYSRGKTNDLVREADLVIFVGSNTGDLTTKSWTVPAPQVATVQINIHPSELGKNYPAKVPIHGDARQTLLRFLDSLDGAKRFTLWAGHCRETICQGRMSWEDAMSSKASPIRPERLCSELTRFLPQGAILVADTGHAGIWSGAFVLLTRPGQRYIRAAGSLGWGFPAALGAKCAAPDRTVVCFTGDGGFWYHLTELETAARYGIHTITVVNNNQCFSQCSPASKFIDVDFSRIAREMGCQGLRIEDPADIEPALNSALDMDAPLVLDVVTDAAALPPN